MVLWSLYYIIVTTQIWCYHHSNIYFSKYPYGTTTTQIWCYHHSNLYLNHPKVKKYPKDIYTFLRSFLIHKGHYYSKNGTMILKVFFLKDIIYQRNYVLKTIFNSEGT